jgi:hypothetical protein
MVEHITEHRCIRLAEQLNAGCQCNSLDRQRLAAELERVSPGFHDEVMAGRPHLFSDSVTFVSGVHVKRMAELVAAVEHVVALPAYRAHVLAYAPQIAQHVPEARGVFLGYDFHLGAGAAQDWPQLIEINTNAGGGLLNAVLARAQKANCDEVGAYLPGDLSRESPEHLFLAMFRREFFRGHRVPGVDFLRTVAIVDETPQEQYLYPEFVLFQRLFAQAGITAVICPPQALQSRDGALWQGETRIDLVYNRLTDFALETSASAALRAAWLADAVVVTPHPHAHALYADKRNLVALSDDALLMQWDVDEATRRVLAGAIPRTELVAAKHADDLWARRRQLFFKPAAGYGSKAAYRGDKMTKRVFESVLAGNYIAQALVPPSSRTLNVAGDACELKLDLRNYVYDGHVQLIAARLWQGQTTNFRTPGGGFAPVLTIPCSA